MKSFWLPYLWLRAVLPTLLGRSRAESNVARGTEVPVWLTYLDFSNGVAPEVSSFTFGITGENITYGLFGEDERLLVDSRGYITIIKGEAWTFLDGDDSPGLLLNTIVADISRSHHGVTVHDEDGSCISAFS
ncbi:hypothetical protein AC578_6564 [Pseudocercospora eumusae]|uniref:Uncharacterized protein n=1 Tax=Pseudocercospora eumusae TaxID=321146 RepID=A0A139HHS2_9PEZI|nr:hypothetical protein AC578_6564 [Pseudocercospora eumusae]